MFAWTETTAPQATPYQFIPSDPQHQLEKSPQHLDGASEEDGPHSGGDSRNEASHHQKGSWTVV